MNPLISFLMPCRTRGEYHQGKDIFSFFDSCVKHLSAHVDNMEFLIKFDEDDEMAQKEVLSGQLNQYPFIIRPIMSKRWEGRKCINLFYTYLFQNRNPASKFIGILSDDALVVRDFIPDVIARSNEKYCIIGDNGGNKKLMNEVGQRWRQLNTWTSGKICTSFPISTANIIEITGNMGWSVNVDGWFGLIALIMYEKYQVDLWRNVELYMSLNWKQIPEERYTPINSTFNDDMYLSISQACKNEYYFTLTEQQAKNIYLNMKYEGLR
jgi:hypothetical protein